LNRKILRYFNTHKLIEGLIVALLGSLFIYLNLIGFESKILETLFGILFFIRILIVDFLSWFWIGFFIGIFWFWWIGVSFYYYGHIFAIPFIILLIGITYAILFFIFAKMIHFLSFSKKEIEIFLRGVFLYLLSYIHPFGFNWLKPELILLHSPIGVDKLHFGLFLISIVLFLILKSFWKIFALFFFIISISIQSYQILPQEPEKKIYLQTTWIDVRDKWNVEKIPFQIRDTLVAIDRAIANKKSAIILPESILPFFLNKSKLMLEELKRRSKEIDIILGALYRTPKTNRNSLFFFHKGSFIVSDKIVLVPFGENNPLPSWASKWINKIFFDGAPDYMPAKKPTDFKMENRLYRGAICYEGTSDKIYKNIPERLILISNNGWFYPSIEPTLQRLLLEYYERIYKIRIYHSINYSNSYVIIPKSSFCILDFFKEKVNHFP